jgi:Tfp pilus assembly protein PilP
MAKLAIFLIAVVLMGCKSSNHAEKDRDLSSVASPAKQAELPQQTYAPWQDPAYQQKLMTELFPNAPKKLSTPTVSGLSNLIRPYMRLSISAVGQTKK